MNRQERLKKAVAYLKGQEIIETQKDLAEKIGYNKSNLSSALNGNEKYLTDMLLEKVSILSKNLNKLWLLTGEGSMLIESTERQVIKLEYEVFPVPEEEYMVVEFLDLSASAGALGGADVSTLPEAKTRLVPREYGSGKFLVVQIYGNSMDDRSYRSVMHGDEVLVKLYTDDIRFLPINYKLFIIVTMSGSVLKQITKVDSENEQITCHSFNPDWEDYTISFEEIIQIFVVEKKVKSSISF